MKLLIVTQTVDTEDPALGFFVGWIQEFAKHAERVEVICLKKGKYALPAHVRVHSLGKEKPPRYARRLVYAVRFKLLAWRLRHDYDAVFVHMNPEYVVLGGAFWRMNGKRIVLWYTHRAANLKLRIAIAFAHVVATAAPESLRIRNAKVRVLGHGIDTAQFIRPEGMSAFHTPLRLVSVGRITPIKNLDVIIEALGILRTRGISAELTLIGAATVPSDRAYEQKLRTLVSKRDLDEWVHFRGAVPYAEMPRMYGEQDISVNAAPTGGIDKAVLEAMACSVPAIASNEAFAALFGPERAHLSFKQNEPQDLAAKIEALCRRGDIPALQQWAHNQIVQHASLTALVARILQLLS